MYKTFDKPRKKANAAIVEEGYESAETLNITPDQPSKEWVLDSCCTLHMSRNQDWFEYYIKEDEGFVLLGNNKACKVIGSGNIRIKMTYGYKRILKNIIELKRNLISLGTLEQHDYSFQSEIGILTVSKDKVIVFKGYMINDLYYLAGSTIIGSSSAIEKEKNDKCMLWHKRLGHVNENGISVLSKVGYLSDHKLRKLDFCEDCILRKSSRASFIKATHRT